MHRSIILTAFLQACLQKATAQFTGLFSSVGSESSGILTVTILNNSTGNYSIEARNNLFDNANPYQPLQVRNLAGVPITLVGTQTAYGPIADSAFVTMSPGSIWEKTLNMTEYIPPDATATKPYSECFSVNFPDGLFAVNTTDFVGNEDLATGFLKGDSADIFITGTPLHLNITIQPGKQAASTATTATVGAQQFATLVQGTASPGPGGAAPSYGSSIDDYLGVSSGIFAKGAKPVPS